MDPMGIAEKAENLTGRPQESLRESRAPWQQFA